MDMESICKKYLKPISAIATFALVLFTIILIWGFGNVEVMKVLWLKGFYSYIAWMIGVTVVYKIYVLKDK